MQTKIESLRKQKTQTQDMSKRVIVGYGKYDDTDVILLTIITPSKPRIAMMLPLDTEIAEDMEVFDMLGDKINELKSEGYSVEYRLKETKDEPIVVKSNNQYNQ